MIKYMTEILQSEILLCYSLKLYSGIAYNFGLVYTDSLTGIHKINIEKDTKILIYVADNKNNPNELRSLYEGKFLSAKISECGDLEQLCVVTKDGNKFCVDMTNKDIEYVLYIPETKY